MYYYDYLLTFDDEVRFIWNRKKTQSSYWYLCNRYLGFFGNIAVLVMSYVTLNAEGCKEERKFKYWSITRQILLVANQVLGCVLLTLRTYALYTRDKRVLWFMLFSMAALFSLACWSLTGQKNTPTPTSGCHLAMSKETAINLAIPWESLFAYDTLIFIMTLAKTYKMRYQNTSLRSLPLVSLVVRDGAAYFGIMALSTLANILTFLMAGVRRSPASLFVLRSFRFCSHLHEAVFLLSRALCL
jgi:hypothetical protein